MREQVDVVVVGGAVVGSAVAYALKRAGFPGRVLVIERDPTYARASTTLSCGGIRQQFSTEENILLSQYGLRLIRDLQKEHGSDAGIGFREQGYLILASEEGAETLSANVAIQRGLGADIALLDRTTLQARFPWMSVEGLACGGLGRSGEGWFDPWAWMNLLRAGSRTLGAEWRTGEVTAVVHDDRQVSGVVLSDGRAIDCGVLVNAAGPAAGKVAGMAGIALPVGPRKRYVFVFDCREASEALHQAPLTIDASGLYFRPEGRQFITGLSPEEADEPAQLDFEVDHEWFTQEIWPRLAMRVPTFEAIKATNAWVGHYDYNDLDQNAIVGPHPRLSNFYFANGFSGHGLQQAPAVGQVVAEHIMHGEYRTVDVTRFGYQRIAAGAPLAELNVI
ncbi:MAG TPA: FAD-binding oxidoreductase [Aestuariivirgaceae bacterium]|jgi:FAD-dependent oxidoreductase domain-containing protein 1|nr:FAD-binding oxidoreductase [Aestuariivirgaceae bacterium]